MFKRIFCISYFFAFSVLAFAQEGNRKNEHLSVFSVGKDQVSVDEFVQLYKKNYQSKKEEFTKEKIGQYLALFINFKLKVAEAKARGMDTTSAFKKEFNSYRDELRKPYLPEAGMIDSLVRLTYERMKEEISASHILVAVKPEASAEEEQKALKKILDIRTRALAGDNFDSLAADHSDDPSAKLNKGHLGFFTAMQMVYPFENAAYQSKKGDITQPVRTRFGYHILRINERRPSKGEVEVSHILIRTGEEKDNSQAKNTIFEIYDQLQKGVSWHELCRQYSEDPGTRDTGGKLRPFGVGVMSSIPEFEHVAFELDDPGDYSDPFETRYGWHIVRLERKIPLQSFDALAPSIKGRVSKDERLYLSRQALYDQLKTRYGFSANPAVQKQLTDMADTTLTQGKWDPVYKNAEQGVIFTLKGKNYTVADFIAFVIQNQKRSHLAPAKYLEQLLNGFSDAMLLEALEADIIKKTPGFRWILQEYYEGILLFDIMEKEVWNKASADTAGQRSYFLRNAGKYKAGERIRADLYSSTTKVHVDLIDQALLSKDTSRVNETVRTYKVKKESGLFEKDDRIVFSKIPWKAGVHRAENNNLYYVAYVIEIVPPGQKTFEEARPDLISDYQNAVEQDWIASLKKKYPVRINKKGKNLAIQELLKSNFN